MKKSAVYIAVLFTLATLAALCPVARGMCSGDEWYSDGDGHWASRYIRVLWKEEVSDGEESASKKGVFLYRPDNKVTRAQYVALLFKVFQLPPAAPCTPSYPDVPETYRMLRKKPAWEFIEGALAGGISFVPPGVYFEPDRYTTREDAVEFLVRSLDLEPYAQSMSPDQVRSVLEPFRDWAEISPARRNSMACAVSLGILEGYEDGRLRPLRYMTRAEATTVVCRSCLIRASAELDQFSPDGDGVDDFVGFDISYLKNRGIREWDLSIHSESGLPVYYFNPDRCSRQPPFYLTWDGKNSEGDPVPAGLYYYQAWVKDSNGRVFSSVAKPLIIQYHSLIASLTPDKCADGRTLTLLAATVPNSSAVTATFVNGAAKNLGSDDGGSTWQTQLTMGPPLPLGPQPVEITATFPGTFRTITLTFERSEDIWLVASVEPNPASWGQLLSLTCKTSPSVYTVSVSLLGIQHILEPGPTGFWTGTGTVPIGVPEGIYPALFVGVADSGTASATVPLELQGPRSTEIIYVLSK